jgi:hypothetical protein
MVRTPLLFLLIVLLAVSACRAGASDRSPDASALGADSAPILKPNPTAWPGGC